MTTLKKNIQIFSTYSSVPMFITTFLYLSKVFRDKRLSVSGNVKNINFETIIIIIPFLYGIAGIANYNVTRKNKNYSLIVGAVFGLMLSVFGRFIFHLPIKLFNFTSDNEYMVHIFAIIFYALLFRFVITPFADYLLSDDTNDIKDDIIKSSTSIDDL